VNTVTATPESWMFDERGKPIRDEKVFHERMNEYFADKYAGLSRPVFGLEIMNLPDPRWAMENLIQEEGITMIHGSPGAGKSLMAMDWAYVLAHPQLESWMGQRRLRQFKPMYIFTEGFAGLKPRSEAWSNARGVSIRGTRGKDDGVLWQRDAVRLNRQDNEQEPWSEQMAALYQMYLDYDRDILFVDTLANTFFGNENSQQDANNYLAALRLFQAHGPVVIVHHNKKENKEFRGSTVFEGAVDTKVAVEESNGIVHLYITKQKDGDPGFAMDMRLNPVVLRETEEYDVTSVVLEQVDRLEGAAKVTPKQQEILNILSEGPCAVDVIAHQRGSGRRAALNMLNRMRDEGLVDLNDDGAWFSQWETEGEAEEL